MSQPVQETVLVVCWGCAFSAEIGGRADDASMIPGLCDDCRANGWTAKLQADRRDDLRAITPMSGSR